MIESGLNFSFAQGFVVNKFDDLPFYRERFSKLPHGKGVDFLAVSKDCIILVEVKNCQGDERNNRWRIFPNNSKLMTTNTATDTSHRSSLDIEVSEKVAMTLACLTGAYTQCENAGSAAFSKRFWDSMTRRPLPAIKIILFLEGNFGTPSRSKEMIMHSLTMSIKNKLSWLACQVIVEDSATCKRKYYSASGIKVTAK